jgi:hypothetical protein
MNIHISAIPLKSWPLLVFVFLLAFVLVIDFPIGDTPKVRLVGNAEAYVGAPATPGSVSGVRRRTRRRTAAVVTAATTAPAATAVVVGTVVHALPGGCNTVLVKGISYNHCGGVYYRPYYDGDKLVYVVENP